MEKVVINGTVLTVKFDDVQVREAGVNDLFHQSPSGAGLDDPMSRIFLGILQPFGRAFPTVLSVWTRMRLAILCGLALAFMASSGTASNNPTSISSIDQAAHPAAHAEPATFGSEPEPQAAELQEPKAQPLSRPLTSELTASSPPQISFEDGQLTIIADNSLLSDILSEVRTLMGADIDLPANASGERIWVRLGPGPARRVLGELLSNTNFNYVIQASDTDVDGIKRILLTLRNKTAAPDGLGMSAGQLPQGTIRRVPQMKLNGAEVSEQQNPVSAEAPTSSETAPAVPPAPTASADLQPAVAELQPPAAAVGDNASKTTPRTTDEMIQQLQAMYQQRRQMQQGKKSPGQN